VSPSTKNLFFVGLALATIGATLVALSLLRFRRRLATLA